MAQLNRLRKQIEWADAKERICVEKFARDLEILYGSDNECWTFQPDALKSGERIEIAELVGLNPLRGWSLGVQGKFNTSKLTPNTDYEVLFDIKVNHETRRLEDPVELSLKSAEKTINAFEKKLDELRDNFSWVEIPIGRFNTGRCGIGEIEFKLHNYSASRRSGLVVRGVIIRAV